MPRKPQRAPWERRFAELEEFHRLHGHMRLPMKGRAYSRLREWVKAQRREAEAGTLNAEHWRRLVTLGFEWDQGASDWASWMNELRVYERRHGHCRVPKSCAEYPALARWVIRVRKRYREGKLRQDRVQALEQAGFEWDAKPAQEAGRWQGQLARLVKFRERFGHCRVPCKWREDSVLGAWVHNQRAFRKKGMLSAERISQLESIGFEWKGSKGDTQSREEQWDVMFALLLDYHRQHGDTLVPRGFREIKGLRRWVIAQRKNREAFRPERRERLEAIGFCWEWKPPSRDERWEQRFAQLIAFRQRFGHCRVPAKWKEDVAFGAWVHVQRAFKKKATISPERIARLDAIGFEWHERWDAASPEEHWQKMFAELIRYRQEHGDADVPVAASEMRCLREWIQNQREAHGNGTLRADRREQLEAIGFPWRSPRSVQRERWERRFEQLVAYRQQHRHCRVPAKWPEDVAFASWVDVQRQFRRRGQLSPERIQRLDEIGFEWKVGRWPATKAKTE